MGGPSGRLDVLTPVGLTPVGLTPVGLTPVGLPRSDSALVSRDMKAAAITVGECPWWSTFTTCSVIGISTPC